MSIVPETKKPGHGKGTPVIRAVGHNCRARQTTRISLSRAYGSPFGHQEAQEN